MRNEQHDRTCKDDVERRSLSNPTCFRQGFGKSINNFVDETFLGRRIDLRIALGNHMERHGPVAVFGLRGLRRVLENRRNDPSTNGRVAFAGDCLVDDRRRNVIVHGHAVIANEWMLIDILEDFIPFVIAAESEELLHGRMTGCMWLPFGRNLERLEIVCDHIVALRLKRGRTTEQAKSTTQQRLDRYESWR
jgi:hypothetical protein